MSGQLNRMNQFLVRLIAISLLLSGIYFLSGDWRPVLLTHSLFYVLILVFALITALFHAGLVRAEKRGGPAFIRYYMGATMGKLFLYMGLIVIYAFAIDQDTRSFIILFFLLYLVYTAFEVSFIYGRLSQLKASRNDSKSHES